MNKYATFVNQSEPIILNSTIAIYRQRLIDMSWYLRSRVWFFEHVDQRYIFQ